MSDKKKSIGSTVGMQTSVETSPYLKCRINDVVPYRMEKVSESIKRKDFQTFAEHTMRVGVSDMPDA